MAHLAVMLCFLVAIFGSHHVLTMLAGGWSEVNLSNDLNSGDDDSDGWTTAETFYFDSENVARGRLSLVSVQRQVVSGINYRFSYAVDGTDGRCTAVVYVHWSGKMAVSSDTCESMVGQARSKRMVPGQSTAADINSPEVQNAINFAVSSENKKSNSRNFYKATSVISATEQLVQGKKYTLKYRIQATECLKNLEDVSLEDCEPIANGQVMECQSKVWVRMWLPTPNELKEHSCQPVATEDNQGLLGGDGHDIGNFGAFQAFKQQYGRIYDDDKEEQVRFQIFQDNMQRAAKIQETEKGTARYGVTKFADVSREEFQRYFTSGQWDLRHNPALKPARIPTDPAPAEYDWRNHSAVSEVKNQGMCGSCWAFSTTGNIEGQWAIKKGQLVSLSEQELVDCDKVDEGCNGGLPSNAYQEIIRLGGLETETKYPYDGKDESCQFKVSDVKVYINGSLNISTDEGDMAAWLAKNGPISIGINANAMQFYMGGISHPWKIFCNPNNLDHGVLIVGYGTKDNTPYWIVKNSWGTNWGEKGYYLVYRGSGVCGLNKMPTSATIG